jgi:hypothetical protein
LEYGIAPERHDQLPVRTPSTDAAMINVRI